MYRLVLKCGLAWIPGLVWGQVALKGSEKSVLGRRKQ